MACSYRKVLFTTLQLVLIMLTIFVASPESGVDCRPLFLNYHYHWSWDNGLLLQSLPNGSAPPSKGDPTRP